MDRAESIRALKAAQREADRDPSKTGDIYERFRPRIRDPELAMRMLDLCPRLTPHLELMDGEDIAHACWTMAEEDAEELVRDPRRLMATVKVWEGDKQAVQNIKLPLCAGCRAHVDAL